MFNHCISLEKVDLSNFNCNSIFDMTYMFFECKSLKEINMSNYEFNDRTSMWSMLKECSDELKEKMKEKYKLKDDAFN